MHSSIFQISTQPIGKENYIDENTFIDGDFSFYDYCANMSDEQRKEEISDLVEYKLPKGMFELTSEDTILYKGGVEQWKKEFVANIHEKAETLTVENMLEWRPLYNLEQAIENPLDTNYRFYLDGTATSPLPKHPLLLWNLFADSNPTRHSMSEGLWTTISDVP